MPPSTTPSSLPRRMPLWVAFVPLLIGGLGYGWLWSGYAERLRADVGRVLPGRTVTISGFPYRVAASVDTAKVAVDRPGLTASLTAAAATVDRGPWHPELSVVRLSGVEFRLAVPPLRGVMTAIDAPAALVSVHVEDGKLQRLSTVFDHPRFSIGLFPGALTATRLETHVREMLPALTGPSAPTPPVQAQLVVAGTGVQLAGGDPLRLDADVAVTGNQPLRSVAGWAAGGTAEVRRLTLADASGEVLALVATAVPGAAGRLQFAGTIDTICPASVAVLFNGGAVSEQRLRRPVRLSFAGPAGTLRLAAPDTVGLARRTQLPPCPVLRRSTLASIAALRVGA